MDNTTIGLIVTSILLIISEILPYIPSSKAKGVVQSMEVATVNVLEQFKIPVSMPKDGSVIV